MEPIYRLTKSVAWPQSSTASDSSPQLLSNPFSMLNAAMAIVKNGGCAVFTLSVQWWCGWTSQAFPFDTITIDGITVHPNWIEPIVNNIDPTIPIWIKEEKYIFFYGGKDNDWIQQFRKSAQTLVVDPVLKDAKINIELFGVGKGSTGGEDLGIIERFWKGIDSLFFTQIHHQHVDSVSKEVQKLLSYKNESGWALLSKGSKVVVTGHGFTILRVVDEFEKWKGLIKEKAFETAFKEYHNNVLSIIRHCSRLDIPNDAGKVPETMPCPECHRVMKTYKCCHVDGPLEAHH